MNKKNIFQDIRNKSYAYAFLLPMVIGMLIIHFVPIIIGIIISFLDLNQYTLSLYLKAPFVGLKNYYDVLFNPQSTLRIGLFQAVRNTVIYTICVICGCMGLGMIVALMLNENRSIVKLFRTLYLFPWIVPTYVTGLLWGFMWNHEIGVVNYLLTKVFKLFSEPPFWLIGPNTLFAIIIPTIWRYWPYYMLMLLAGLQTIPDELNEAATIDGASEWQKFWYITLPLLKPVWSILLLIGIISNVYSFNIVIMMFGHGAGFPGEWGDLLMTNIFRNSFNLWQFSKGAAASIILMIVMIGVVAMWYKIFGRNKW